MSDFDLSLHRVLDAIEELREALPESIRPEGRTPILDASWKILMAVDYLPARWAEDRVSPFSQPAGEPGDLPGS